MMFLALQGRLDEALAVGCRAYADLNAGGDEFMLLDGLAMIAAEQGRLRDAAITTVRSDAEFAARRFRRWPLSVEWRRRTDARLAAVPADELSRWKREAVHVSPFAAVEQVGRVRPLLDTARRVAHRRLSGVDTSIRATLQFALRLFIPATANGHRVTNYG